jgi:hypothetical protein
MFIIKAFTSRVKDVGPKKMNRDHKHECVDCSGNKRGLAARKNTLAAGGESQENTGA